MSVATHDHIKPVTSPNGTKAAESLQDLSPLPRSPIWSQLIGKAKELVKQVDDKYSISRPMALVLIAGLITVGGAWYWRSSDKIQEQHDEIIRLQTKLDMQEKANVKFNEDITRAIDYGISAKGEAKELSGRFQQFAIDYAVQEKKRNQ